MKLSSIFNRGNSRSSALQSGAIGAAPLSSSVRPLALEQRFMFDGAAVDAAADAAQAHLADMAASDAQHATMLWVPPAMEVRAASAQLLESKKEVVLLDTSLANYHTLKAAVPEGMGIVVFDGAADGLAQIAAWAAGQSGLDAIHLFSHGNDGQLHLGSATLTAVSLSHAQVQEQLATLGRALQADGDLLLYGCDVAKTQEGQDFIRHLALLTGADIAASSDATGSALKGGDWDLEYRNGMIEATALTASAYQGVLSQTTFTFENAVLENSGLIAKQVLGNHTLVMTAPDKSFLLATESALGVGVDTAADGKLLLVNQQDGQNVITLTLKDDQLFDLTSFALVDIHTLNQGLKLTTSKGSETFSPAWNPVTASWVFNISSAVHQEYFQGITSLTISASVPEEVFAWGFDNIVLSNIPNRAPVLEVATFSLPSLTDSQTDNTGVLVSSLYNQNNYTDADSVDLQGIAITSVSNGLGRWQYSLDGSTWNNVGTVAENSALLLRSTDRVRFVPDGINSTSGSFNYRAWDQTGTTAGGQGSKADTSINGGASPFSNGQGSASVSVEAVNDAPVVAVPGSISVIEDVASALTGISFSDLDAGDASVKATFTVPSGTLSAASGAGVLVQDSGTAVLKLSGTLSNINAFIAASNLKFQTALNSIDNVLLTVSINDQGNTGGTAQTDTKTVVIHVIAVNEVPTVIATGTNPPYTENTSAVRLFTGATIDTVESGQSVLQMVFTVSGIANGAAEKLVIDGTDVTLVQGTSLTTSANGISITVSVSSGTATVTLDKADGLSTATAQTILNSIAYRNDSEAPTTVNRVVTLSSVSDSGGTANGGQPTASVGIFSTVTVVGVNDAPILANGPYNFATITEDVTATGVQISTVLASHTMVDPDAGALRGVAIIGKTGNGTWQYSTDNSNWTDFGAVSNNSSLLLASTTYVRYVPDAANGETATLSFRGWDQTTGTASVNGVRSTADTTSNGGTTAFSIGTGAVNQIVTSVNDAPVMIGVAPTLSGINDDAINNAGAQVSSLLGGVTDVDTGALKGMAIISVTATYGKWQYSTNAGSTWSDVGSVSVTTALILTAQNMVRFVPDGIHGETATITYKAWDQTNATSGLQGTKTNTTISGGTSAYSTWTDTASVVVTAVNDAPVVTVSGGSASWTEGNNVASTPVVVDPGLTLSDADGPNPLNATARMLTYYSAQDTLSFVNDGLTMGNIVGTWTVGNGTLTLTSAGNQATVAQFEAALRAITYNNSSNSPNSTTRTVQFIVTDGSNAQSTAVTRDVSITAVNDSPTISAVASLPVTEDTQTALGQITFSDVDSTLGVATFSVGSGTLSAIGAGGVTVGGTATALTLSGTLANINNFIAANRLLYTPAANASGDVTLTININTTSVSDATTTVTLQVAAVNDAPVITAPASITVTEDVSSVISGFSFTDVDAGINTVTATFSVPSGTLSAVTGMGITVTGSDTGELTLSGSLADINFFVAANGVTFKTAQDATASVTLTVTLNDKGFSGSGGEKTDTKTVTLNVSAVNDPPVNNVPGAQTASQNIALGFNTANGNAISITDVDAGNGLMTVTLTATNGTLSLGSLSGITLLLGTGSNDGSLVFEGNRANLNAALQTLSFKSGSTFLGAASLTIETNDNGNSGSGGAKTDVDTISINVVPVNPKVTSVSAQGIDRTVKIGDEVLISMTWDQVVNVDLTGGSPTLLLETGLSDREAVYVNGSGSNTLVFKYVVQAGDISTDLDFQSSVALQLNGSVLANATSDLAVLTLPTVGGADSLGGRSNIKVDGVVPVVTSVGVPSDGTYALGHNLDFTVNFSENVVVDSTGGVPRIAVTLDTGGTVYADYVSGSGSSALVFRLTVASGQLDSNGVTLASSLQLNGGSIRDTAGNDTVVTLNALGSAANVNIDGVVPTVTSVTTPLSGSYKAGDVLTFTVNASEALQNGAQPPQLVLDVGGVTRYATYVSGSGSSALVFQYTVQATDNDGGGIVVSSLDLRGEPLTDLAGNDLNLTLNGVGSAAMVVDHTAPSAGSIVRVDADPSFSSSVRFTVTFSEDVSGVDSNDFNLVFGGSASGTISSVTAVDGRTYTVVVGGLAGAGSLRLDLNSVGTDIVDAAGNAVTGGLTGASYLIDRTVPSVTPQVQVQVPANGTYITGQHLDFTVRWDEAVFLDTSAGTPRLAVQLDNGVTAYANYFSGAGTNALVFRFTVAAGQLDSNGISVGTSIDLQGAALTNAAGNVAETLLHNVGASTGVLVDGVAPVVSSVSVPAAGIYKVGDVLSFTLNASEALAVQTSGGTPRLVLDIGGVTRYAEYVSGSGGAALVFAYTVAAGDSASQGISVASLDLQGAALTDAAGNAANTLLHNIGVSTGVLVDAVATTASLSLDKGSLNAQETAQLTVRFSKPVVGLDLSDFTVNYGQLSGLSSSDGGLTWHATLTPEQGIAQGNLQVVLNNAGYGDQAGNVGEGLSVSGSYAVDTLVPAALQVQVTSSPGSAVVQLSQLVPGAVWEYSLNDGVSWTQGSGSALTLQSVGTYVLQVRQSSPAGNTSVVTSLSVNVPANSQPPVQHLESAPLPLPSGASGTVVIVPNVPSVFAPALVPSFGAGFLHRDSGANSVTGGSGFDAFFRAGLANEGQELSSGFLGLGSMGVNFASPDNRDAGSSRVVFLADPAFNGLTLLQAVDELVLPLDRQVNWQVPATMFGHHDAAAKLQFAMTLADGRPLPNWLRFDPNTRHLEGRMPAGVQGESLLRLTVRDPQGRTVNITIKLTPSDGSSVRSAPHVRHGVAEQFARAAQQRASSLQAQALHVS